MAGTWGTSEEAETISEHDVQYDFGDIDSEVFTRSEQGFAWTVYEDCPHIAQVDAQTRVSGRGWVSCTAITGPKGSLGILFNDTALSHSEFDEAKQARAAVLCSILGRALSTIRISPNPPREGEKKAQHRVVREVTQLLAREPSLSCEALAKRLKMKSGQLALTFKQHALTSIVDHRNEIRLARFLERVDTLAGNLREAALEAGFGSYAQFHRVFRARFGQAPRDYLLEHRNSV
jgi:AraC-like DNA-binding protein